MKQRIIIALLPPNAAVSVLEDADRLMAEESFVPRLHELLDQECVLFYSDHLDTWSMGDSFDRFLRPKSKLRFVEHHSDQLYAISYAALDLRATPRNHHERLLRLLLHSAKTADRRFPDAVLFVFRQVLGASDEGPADLPAAAKRAPAKKAARKRS